MRKMATACAAGLAAVLTVAAPAVAHDGWVQAYAPIVAVGENAYVDLLFGNHSNSHGSYRIAGKWNLSETKVFALAPDGDRTDLTAQVFDTGEDADQVGPKGIKGYHSVSFTPDQNGLFIVWAEGDSLFKQGNVTTRTLRSAKTFVAAAKVPLASEVADLKGFDRPIAPDRLEIVPLVNPVAVTPGAPLRFQVLWRSQPAAGQDVTVVRRTTAAKATYRADDQGIVSFPAGDPDFYLVRTSRTTDESNGQDYQKTAYEATVTFVVQHGEETAHSHLHGGPAGEPPASGTPTALEIRVNGRLLDHWDMRNNRAYVPAQDLADALGLTVNFNPAKPDHGVFLQRNGKYLHLHMNDFDAHVDGKSVQLDSPAVYLQGDHPMVPVRFVAEAYGAAVTYTPATAGRPPRIDVTWAP